MSYYPIFLNLKNKRVVIIGAGKVAYRKIKALINAHATITLVSPRISPQIEELVQANQCFWLKQSYQKEAIKGAFLVLACTDNSALNQQIALDANQEDILVNVIDNIDNCDFITPAIVEHQPVQIAFASAGASPSLMRYLRQRFEQLLPQNLSLLASFAQSKRKEIKKSLPNNSDRQAFWDAFFAQAHTKSTTEEFEELYTYLLRLSLNLA